MAGPVHHVALHLATSGTAHIRRHIETRPVARIAWNVIFFWFSRAMIHLHKLLHRGIVRQCHALVVQRAAKGHEWVFRALYDQCRYRFCGMAVGSHVLGKRSADDRDRRDTVGQIARQTPGHESSVGHARGVNSRAVDFVLTLERIDQGRDEFHVIDVALV